jgi:hypothetical protein
MRLGANDPDVYSVIVLISKCNRQIIASMEGMTMNNNDDGLRTDVLDDDGAPHAAAQRYSVPAPPDGVREARSPEQASVPNASSDACLPPST